MVRFGLIYRRCDLLVKQRISVWLVNSALDRAFHRDAIAPWPAVNADGICTLLTGFANCSVCITNPTLPLLPSVALHRSITIEGNQKRSMRCRRAYLGA